MASTSFPPCGNLSFTGKLTPVPVSDNWLNLIEVGGDYMSIGSNFNKRVVMNIGHKGTDSRSTFGAFGSFWRPLNHIFDLPWFHNRLVKNEFQLLTHSQERGKWSNCSSSLTVGFSQIQCNILESKHKAMLLRSIVLRRQDLESGGLKWLTSTWLAFCLILLPISSSPATLCLVTEWKEASYKRGEAERWSSWKLGRSGFGILLNP